MNVLPRNEHKPRRPNRVRPSQRPPMQLARHYQDLARRHPDEKAFWLCRASYFGRASLRERTDAYRPGR
jgi:hypothetical protein